MNKMMSKLSLSLLEKGKAKKEWVLFINSVHSKFLTWESQVTNPNSNEKIIQGISSLHSWIKTQTMIKPSKISRQHSREDEEDEDEPEVVIHLDSFNPQAARNDVFKMEYFYQSTFLESVSDMTRWSENSSVKIWGWGKPALLTISRSRVSSSRKTRRK